MATRVISILGSNTVFDSTGRAFAEPFSVKATNDIYRNLVAIFNNPGTDEAHGFYGQFTVPQNYVGGATIIPVWTSTDTTGNARYRFSYRTVGGDDTTSLDQASHEEQVSVTDAAPTAALRRLTPSMALTAANLTAGETVEFLFERLDDSGTDTLAAATILFDLLLQYTD
jgi:predicted carbohydrate-binding protein with CBM5 and CBM33 domain